MAGVLRLLAHPHRLKIIETLGGGAAPVHGIVEALDVPQATASHHLNQMRRLSMETGVVDVDASMEEDQLKLFFRVDREKTGLDGISVEDVANTLRMALSGLPAGTVHWTRNKTSCRSYCFCRVRTVPIPPD